MRQKIAAGNWKMNLNAEDGRVLMTALASHNIPSDVAVIVAAPHVYLPMAVEIAASNERLHVAAQNCHDQESGAYTGEVSASMLADIACTHVVIGHSERREYQQESDALLATKVDMVLSKGLHPIFCCGEPLEVRKDNNQVAYVSKQIVDGICHLSAADMAKVVIAYEPIWAIGTGETATAAQAQDMHQSIRALIKDRYNAQIAEGISILYGGSVKPANAKEIFAQPDVDGGLVGGASLKAESFTAIIDSFS